MDTFFDEFIGFNPSSLLPSMNNEGLMLLLNAMSAFDHICNEDFYIIDLSRRDIIYMSQNLSEFLGISDAQPSSSLTTRLANCIPSSETDNYKKTMAIFPSIYNSLTLSERSSLVLSGNFHLTNGHRQILVFVRSTPLYTDAEGRLRHILCTLTGASTRQVGNVLITKGRGTATRFYSLDDKKWHDLQVTRLNDREQMVLNLAARGYTAEEMSLRLGISVDSIKKSRKDILKKTGAQNLPQAIKMAYNLRKA